MNGLVEMKKKCSSMIALLKIKKIKNLNWLEIVLNVEKIISTLVYILRFIDEIECLGSVLAWIQRLIISLNCGSTLSS